MIRVLLLAINKNGVLLMEYVSKNIVFEAYTSLRGRPTLRGK
jgi:hypothetical protein